MDKRGRHHTTNKIPNRPPRRFTGYRLSDNGLFVRLFWRYGIERRSVTKGVRTAIVFCAIAAFGNQAANHTIDDFFQVLGDELRFDLQSGLIEQIDHPANDALEQRRFFRSSVSLLHIVSDEFAGVAVGIVVVILLYTRGVD